MKKIYEAPTAEIISFTSLEQLAVLPLNGDEESLGGLGSGGVSVMSKEDL